MKKDLRNWPAIAELEDQELRLFFMTIFHSVVLKALAKGLPKLFHSHPREFQFPLSLVKEKAVEQDKKINPEEWDHEGETRAEMFQDHWSWGCERLKIPLLEFHQASYYIGKSGVLWSGAPVYPIPYELECQLQLQLRDLSQSTGMLVVLQGIPMVVVDWDDFEKSVILARADHIDLTT